VWTFEVEQKDSGLNIHTSGCKPCSECGGFGFVEVDVADKLAVVYNTLKTLKDKIEEALTCLEAVMGGGHAVDD